MSAFLVTRRLMQLNAVARPSIQVRCFGITDTVTQFATDKLMGNKEKKFMDMLDLMISKPKWTLRDWKQTLDDQLNSWTMYLPGMKAQAKDMQSCKEILDKMAPQHLDNPSLIDGKAKEQLSRSTGKPIDEVQKMMTMYNQSVIVAKWLQMKKAAGEAMPDNEASFARMQENDIRLKQIAQKQMKGHKTGRSRVPPL